MAARKFGAILLMASLSAIAIASCSSQRATRDDQPAETTQEIWSPRWLDLGGDAQGDPTISSMWSGHLSVFWRGTDNFLKHRFFENTWGAIESLGGDVRTPPAAVAKPWQIDVFYFNSNGDLGHHFWPNASGLWSIETIPLGGADKPASGSGPAVASWEAGRLDVFWRGVNSNLLHITRPDSSSGWLGVEDLDGIMTSDPAAVSWGGWPNLDVFYRGPDGALVHRFYPDPNWEWGAHTLTGPNELTTLVGPGVSSWGAGRLDVFWRRPTGTVAHTYRWDGAGPHDANWVGGIEPLGGNPGSGVDAVSWGPNRIDIVAKQAPGFAGSTGHNVTLFTWQSQSQHNPFWNDPPGIPTTVIENNVVASGGSLWEFSAAVAPPGDPDCPNGAFVVSGKKNGTPTLLQRQPLNAVPPQSPSDEKIQLLNVSSNDLIEDDSMMTRAPNGDLILMRGIVYDKACGNSTNGCACGTPNCSCDPLNCSCDQQANCTQESCPGAAAERRSGTRIWKSTNCGTTWGPLPDGNIDPLLGQFGGGVFGGGPCWGGWDREEIYYDFFSNRMFVTFQGETDTNDDTGGGFMLRSQLGGAGPFYFHRHHPTGGFAPIMMTSLPGMMFFATCEIDAVDPSVGRRPTLRWIEPENSHWANTVWNQGFPQNSTGMRFAQLPGTCSYYEPDWSEDGSVSVTRVGTYVDDGGTRWWVVRVASLQPPYGRIMTVRVNSAGTASTQLTQMVTANNPPSGQTYGRVVQLTAIEPDPSQTQPSGQPWNGENTTLYYWREEYWTPSGVNRANPQSIVRARAVRDGWGYGPVFDVSTPFFSAVGGAWKKPADFARGGFWVDWNSPNEPLHYIVFWGDFSNGPPNPLLRSKTYRFRKGFGPQ